MTDRVSSSQFSFVLNILIRNLLSKNAFKKDIMTSLKVLLWQVVENNYGKFRL